jgi:hypothetical protein
VITLRMSANAVAKKVVLAVTRILNLRWSSEFVYGERDIARAHTCSFEISALFSMLM